MALVTGTALAVIVLQAFVFNGDDGDDDGDVSTGGAPPVTTGETADTPADEPDTSTTQRSETADDSGSRVRTGNFEDGFWAVGSQIRPGRYIARAQGMSGCTWSRFSDVAGDNVIVMRDSQSNQVIVDILPSDKAFSSERCGVWETYTPRDAPPSTTIRDGDWVVGEQVEPGTYNTTAGGNCSWEHTTGLEHTAEQVIDSKPFGAGGGGQSVELAAGEAFSTQQCGIWMKVG